MPVPGEVLMEAGLAVSRDVHQLMGRGQKDT